MITKRNRKVLKFYIKNALIYLKITTFKTKLKRKIFIQKDIFKLWQNLLQANPNSLIPR